MAGSIIALFLHDRLNDYQARLQTDCEQAARRHDLRLVIHSADKNAESQMRQIRSILSMPESKRPRAIVVSPVSEIAMMPLIYDAAQLGVGWVFLTRWNDAVHAMRRQYPKVPIFAVTANHVEIGRIQGKFARALLDPGDELIYIQGPLATSSSRRRREGFVKELADTRDLRLSEFNSDWSQLGGEAVMKSWLSTFSLQKVPRFVVVAQNDNMAIGARTAVFDNRSRANDALLADLRVVGCDGSPTFGQRMVQSGQLRATIIIPPVAGRAVDELVSSWRTGHQPSAEITMPVQPFPEAEQLQQTRRRA
jgi:ABC-type sugar transport system substrate-binding protein